MRNGFDRRFALGCYDSGGGYSTDRAEWVRQLAEHGVDERLRINVYLNYYLGGMPIDATNALLDVLHERGVSYLQTGNSFEGGSWRRMPFSISSENYVRQFAQHPAALGYYIFDEPHDTLIGETVDHRAQLQAWDPEGVTFGALMAGYPNGQSTRTDPRDWVNAADIIGVDPYPLNAPPDGPPTTYPHFIVADYVSKLRAAVPADRPVWAVLQFFHGNGPTRLPTREEMRAHAIMAIVEGAQGILWWGVGSTQIRQGADPTTVDNMMSNLRELVGELADIEPALLADPIVGVLQNSTMYPDPVAGRIAQLRHNVEADWLYSRKEWYRDEIAALEVGDTSKSGRMLDGAAAIRTRASVANGRGYVLAYNYTNQQQPVTFTVPGIEAFHVSVRESRTSRAYDVVNGTSWSDTFEPYGARVYVLSV